MSNGARLVGILVAAPVALAVGVAIVSNGWYPPMKFLSGLTGGYFGLFYFIASLAYAMIWFLGMSAAIGAVCLSAFLAYRVFYAIGRG